MDSLRIEKTGCVLCRNQVSLKLRERIEEVETLHPPDVLLSEFLLRIMIPAQRIRAKVVNWMIEVASNTINFPSLSYSSPPKGNTRAKRVYPARFALDL